MKVKKKPLLVLMVVGVLIIAGARIVTTNANKPGEYDEFAQCLTDSGAKMFGAYWCSHCQRQKNEFGRSWKLVDYVECSLPNRAGQTQACNEEGISGYPTWEFGDGTRTSGVLPFETLAARSGCVL